MVCTIFRHMRADERGVTAIEYGLIAAMVSMACIATLMNIEGSISTMYNNVATSIETGLDSAH